MTMTRAEHQGWVRHWLKMARAEMKRRDWLAASNALRSAAFHQHVLDLTKRRAR
jgi:hypothetical protein